MALKGDVKVGVCSGGNPSKGLTPSESARLMIGGLPVDIESLQCALEDVSSYWYAIM